MDDTLYYLHGGPLHTLLAASDATGISQGHLWYDRHGSVLTITLPVDLTEQLLSSQGFDGRYYDPVIAHTLQPDPLGGIPQLPWTLNRYAVPPAPALSAVEGASAVGQVSPHLHPLLVTAGKGTAKTALTALIANPARGALIGRLTAPRPTGMLLTLIMSRWARQQYFSSGAASPFECGSVAMLGWGRSFRAYTVRGLVTELEPGLFLTESGELVETSVLPKSAAVLMTEVLRPVNITRFIAGGMFAVALSAGVQLWFDYPNPYLSGQQIPERMFVAGVGGTAAWGIGTGTALGVGWLATAPGWAWAGAWAGPIGIVVGFGAGFLWFGFIQPRAFKALGWTPKRNLAPLR